MGLHEVLEESRTLGFLGPGDVDEHVDHAQALLAVLIELLESAAEPATDSPSQPSRVGSVPGQPLRLLDLGSGGGVPGLVLAAALPAVSVVLLDGAQRRTDFLERAVRTMALPSCSVVAARAEEAGRDLQLRGTFDVVVARSFGPPSVVAECGAPFLRARGHLVVSEPPDATGERWPAEGLAKAGLILEQVVGGAPGFAVLRQENPCPAELPRRVGVPTRRPLFTS